VNEQDERPDGPGRQDSEETLPLSFERPSGPPPAHAPGPAPSWLPPTTQPPPGHWAPFPPPGTPPLPVTRHVAPRGRVPVWLWPAVTVLALVVGVAGGLGGSVAYDHFNDDETPGTVSSGLAGVDTVSQAPLDPDNGSIAAVDAGGVGRRRPEGEHPHHRGTDGAAADRDQAGVASTVVTARRGGEEDVTGSGERGAVAGAEKGTLEVVGGRGGGAEGQPGEAGLDPALTLDLVAAGVAGVDVLPRALGLLGGQLTVEQGADPVAQVGHQALPAAGTTVAGPE
jgi:hypothetical protein